MSDFLSRLDKVRKTGPASWIALCPAHEDKNPSLTISDVGDGTILCHCFAGCSVEEILSAVGLTFDALFPEKPIADYVKPVRRPFPAADVLEAVQFECLVAATAACNVAQGVELTPADRDRLMLAHSRLNEARRLCGIS